MAKAKAKAKATKKTDGNKVGFPNVSPRLGNLPPKPTTIRVCGNVIPVVNGKATEADPKVLRRKAKAAAKQRGGDIDETRI